MRPVSVVYGRLTERLTSWKYRSNWSIDETAVPESIPANGSRSGAEWCRSIDTIAYLSIFIFSIYFLKWFKLENGDRCGKMEMKLPLSSSWIFCTCILQKFWIIEQDANDLKPKKLVFVIFIKTLSFDKNFNMKNDDF